VTPDEVEEVTRIDDFGYVRDTMGLNLVHIVKLLQANSNRALPFEKGTDPSNDLRWIFVGYDAVPGPWSHGRWGSRNGALERGSAHVSRAYRMH
jgi:hypothetical protein